MKNNSSGLNCVINGWKGGEKWRKMVEKWLKMGWKWAVLRGWQHACIWTSKRRRLGLCYSTRHADPSRVGSGLAGRRVSVTGSLAGRWLIRKMVAERCSSTAEENGSLAENVRISPSRHIVEHLVCVGCVRGFWSLSRCSELCPGNLVQAYRRAPCVHRLCPRIWIATKDDRGVAREWLGRCRWCPMVLGSGSQTGCWSGSGWASRVVGFRLGLPSWTGLRWLLGCNSAGPDPVFIFFNPN